MRFKQFFPSFLCFLLCFSILIGVFYAFPAGAAKGVVYQRGDMNGDGQVTSDDAIYLLYHVLFGKDRFPLAGDEGWVEDEPDPSEIMPKKLLVHQVTDFPVANEEMSYEARRQLALDFFELQLSFQWMPDMDITDYPSTYYSGSEKKTLEVGTVYGGIPYQSTGTGNLYRWLEYYDESTGIFALSKALAENGGYGTGAAVTDVKKDGSGNITYKKYRSFQALFNQCSVASFWGWGRVINSANFIWTADMNVFNGFIPVGLFDYGYTHGGKYYGAETIHRWGEKNSEWNPIGYDVDDALFDWIEKNGENAIYECYAKMKKADCLVQPGHTIMVKEMRLLENPDGSINLPQSSILAIEQVESWAETGTLSDGTPYKNQGVVNREYSFEELQKKSYLPFTFAEFMDPEDPQDKAHLDHYLERAEALSPIAKRHTLFKFSNDTLLDLTGAGVEEVQILTNQKLSASSISYSQFSKLAIASNYPISDLFIIIRDAKGNELLKNVFRAPNPQYREVDMKVRKSTWETSTITVSDGVSALANGKNTIEISLQLSNGEKHVVYSGTLTS